MVLKLLHIKPIILLISLFNLDADRTVWYFYTAVNLLSKEGNYMSFIPLLQAAQTGGSLFMFIPLALVFVIFYFFMIRPQNKKQKETEKMIAALKKGDKIVTIGGIHGVVTFTKEQSIIVKVDDNCKIEFSRSAIASVAADKHEKAEKTVKDEKTEVLPEDAAEDSEKDSEGK